MNAKMSPPAMILLWFFSLCPTKLPASADSITSTITDISHWKHPTKAVFQARGIEIDRVDLIDRTRPVFHVDLRKTPWRCDSAGFEATLAEISRANGWWTYVLVDSSSAGTFLKVQVEGNPKSKKTTGIHYLVRPLCRGEKGSETKPVVPAGEPQILDLSKNDDRHIYEIRMVGAPIRIESGEFEIDGLKEISGGNSQSTRSLFLATLSGPGMNCHERYRIVQFDTLSGNGLSDEFGACSDIQNLRRHGDTVIIDVTGTVNENERARFQWDGRTLRELSRK